MNETYPIAFISCLLCIGTACSEPKVATYISEYSLPEGWPKPGPVGEVVEKKYGAYRKASVKASMTGTGFIKLFGHISGEGIPMTAPVEMDMGAGGSMSMKEMAFLYQNTEVGEKGKSGSVTVADVPAMRVLSYAWMGSMSKGKTNAKRALQTELEKRGLEAKGFRMLSYNGPDVPRTKRTYELQAILPLQSPNLRFSDESSGSHD